MATTMAQPMADRSLLLRRAIQADAVVSGVTGAALAAWSSTLEGLLGIPGTYLLVAGALFLLYAAFLAYAGTRPTLSRRLGLALAIANAVWVVDSVVLLAAGWLPLTPAGFWFIVAQAVVVDLLAGAQYLGVRRMRG